MHSNAPPLLHMQLRDWRCRASEQNEQCFDAPLPPLPARLTTLLSNATPRPVENPPSQPRISYLSMQ